MQLSVFMFSLQFQLMLFTDALASLQVSKIIAFYTNYGLI